MDPIVKIDPGEVGHALVPADTQLKLLRLIDAFEAKAAMTTVLADDFEKVVPQILSTIKTLIVRERPFEIQTLFNVLEGDGFGTYIYARNSIDMAMTFPEVWQTSPPETILRSILGPMLLLLGLRNGEDGLHTTQGLIDAMRVQDVIGIVREACADIRKVHDLCLFGNVLERQILEYVEMWRTPPAQRRVPKAQMEAQIQATITEYVNVDILTWTDVVHATYLELGGRVVAPAYRPFDRS